jgi:predicted component of type VI protein secretion system
MRVREQLVVGRDAAADWPVPDREMSGRHFSVRRSDARLLVRDLDSSNGTALNGRWLSTPAEIEAGDVLRAGRCLFVAHAATPPDADETSPEHGLAALPAQFLTAVEREMRKRGRPDPLPALAHLHADDLEAMLLLAPAAGGAPWLRETAAALAERIETEPDDPAVWLHHLLRERFPRCPVFRRIGDGVVDPPDDESRALARRRETVLAAYHEAGKDLARLETLLRSRGMACSQRGLALLLERWGVRAMRIPRRRPRTKR